MHVEASAPRPPTSARGKSAIVVEGGAMRGIFAAGVLDVLHEQELRGFDLAIGTSAGACNLASFVAGQHGRNRRCFTNIMTRRELFSAPRALRGGHFMDLDWLWERFAEEEPLDTEALSSVGTQLISVATCADSGAPVYQHETGSTTLDTLKAGCALPLLYRGPVERDGRRLVDGGIVDPIPVAEAHRRGARRVVIVRSRPAHVVKQPGLADQLSALALRRYPQLARRTRQVAKRYAEAVHLVEQPPAGTTHVHLAPTRPMLTGRTTQDTGKLDADYRLGRACAEAQLDAVRAVLDTR